MILYDSINDRLCSECRDHRRNTELMNDNAVEQTAQYGNNYRNYKRQIKIHIGISLQKRQYHTGQSRDRTAADINPSGDDHHRLRYRQNTDDRTLFHQVCDVVYGTKVIGSHGCNDKQCHNDNAERKFRLLEYAGQRTIFSFFCLIHNAPPNFQ